MAKGHQQSAHCQDASTHQAQHCAGLVLPGLFQGKLPVIQLSLQISNVLCGLGLLGFHLAPQVFQVSCQLLALGHCILVLLAVIPADALPGQCHLFRCWGRQIRLSHLQLLISTGRIGGDGFPGSCDAGTHLLISLVLLLAEALGGLCPSLGCRVWGGSLGLGGRAATEEAHQKNEQSPGHWLTS